MVTLDGYTLLRPSVLVFRGDVAARAVADHFMFGPAFLVSPVTEYKARTRRVYLPAGTDWYDFWTGREVRGGDVITADAPYDALPLFIRAGSIVPLGAERQYIGDGSSRIGAADLPPSPRLRRTRRSFSGGGQGSPDEARRQASTETTVYVYTGRDGAFSIYEDDGVSYGYESRQFSRIPIVWTESSRSLDIGKRAGSFPGMSAARTFNVVLISPGTPVGYASNVAGKRVDYEGKAVRVNF